jgi:glycerol-3-phosphate acyltransferase PlsY
MIYFIIFSIACYTIGSIPNSYYFGKYFLKINILNQGTGHSGLSNLYIFLSYKKILLLLFFDVILKGAIPAYFLYNLFPESIFSLFFIIIGHNWSFLIKFKGGKGLAVSIGIIIGLNYKLFLILLLLFMVFWVLMKFKDSSLPWIIAFFLLPFIYIVDYKFYNFFFYDEDFNLFIITITIFILLLFRRSLGNRFIDIFNYRIFLNRLFFDRESR